MQKFTSKGNFIKTQANAGYIEIKEVNLFDKDVVSKLISKTIYVLI